MTKERKRYFIPEPETPTFNPSKSPDPFLDPQKHLSPSFSHQFPPKTDSNTLFVNDDDLEQDNDLEHFCQNVNAVVPIPNEELKSLFVKYGKKPDGVLLAIDDYLLTKERESRQKESKSTKPAPTIPPISFQPSKKHKTRVSYTPDVTLITKEGKSASNSMNSLSKTTTNPSFSWSKPIGSITTTGQTTRPILQGLQYDEKLEIRLQTGKSSKKTPESTVRLYCQTRELARLNEDLTRILTPLLELSMVDTKVAVLEEVPHRLSTGDVFYITIDCFLTDQAFVHDPIGYNPHDIPSNKAKFDFTAETQGETRLKHRKYAISRLFSQVGLRPIESENEIEVEDLTKDEADEAGEETDVSSSVSPASDDHELNVNQLKAFYQETQSQITSLPPINPSSMSIQLRQYQKLGLSWLLSRENEYNTIKELAEDKTIPIETNQNQGIMNPLWKQFHWPGSNTPFYGNLYSGELSLDKPMIESRVRGGILADEMGLGKTISALSLINSVPYDNRDGFGGNGEGFGGNREISGASSSKPYADKSTLIIVPMSLLTQWQHEFEATNTNSNHKCVVYYGDQTPDITSIIKSRKIPVIIITTYGTVLSEYLKLESRRLKSGKLPNQGLFSVKFFRIILDEAHNIRNRTAKTAHGVYELELSRRWVLTGTPIINRLDDLYSIIKFLRVEPWNHFSYWKTFITVPFENKQLGQTLDVIKTILDPILLRRTKTMKDEYGNSLVTLPNKEVVIEQIRFNEREQMLYDWFKKKASESFRDSVNSGQVTRKMIQILTYILRLRQVCCHSDLVSEVLVPEELGIKGEVSEEVLAPKELGLEQLSDKEDLSKDFSKEVKEHLSKKLNVSPSTESPSSAPLPKIPSQALLSLLNVSPSSECSICTSIISIPDMIITPCGHNFCLGCLLDHIQYQKTIKNSPKCPNCRVNIDNSQLFKVKNQPTSKKDYKFHTGKEINHDLPYQLYLYDSNKTSSKIQALIQHLRRLNNTLVVVFSQFAKYLDIIQAELKLQLGTQVTCLKFDGRLKLQEREQVLKQFSQESPGKIKVLLLTLKAGGVGLNLTSASYAFLMDPWWSPSVEEQAIDRIHRIGQQNDVKVTRFIMENSIETKMLKIQERKKQIGEAVGEKEELQRRRIEELEMLFEE